MANFRCICCTYGLLNSHALCFLFFYFCFGQIAALFWPSPNVNNNNNNYCSNYKTGLAHRKWSNKLTFTWNCFCIRLNGLIVNAFVFCYCYCFCCSCYHITGYYFNVHTYNDDEKSNNTIELAPARPHAVAFDCELTAKASLRCHPQKSFE